MKKKFSVLALVLCMIMLFSSLAACSGGNGGEGDQPSGGDNTPGQTITVHEKLEPGDVAGFNLPHNNGLADPDDQYSYNSDLFYRNETHVNGADPGAIYVSVEDAIDSYNKRKLSHQYDTGNGTYDWCDDYSEAQFIAEYGTQEEYVEAYADMYYVCVTGSTGSISSKTKAKYGNDIVQGAYTMYKCKDFTNWERCGLIDGHAIAIREEDWATHNFWAPEMIRDKHSGLYFMFFSCMSKTGTSEDTYCVTTGDGVNNMYGQVAMCTNPLGPYEFITAEEYIKLRAAKNKDGSVKTGDEWITNEYNGNTYKEVYSNADPDQVIGYYNDTKKVYYNLVGYEVTRQTPVLNSGFYFPRYGNITDLQRSGMDAILRKTMHADGEYVYCFSGIDVFPAVDDDGNLYAYITATDSGSAYGTWGVKMNDFISPDWTTLRMLLKPNVNTIIQDGTFLGRWEGITDVYEGGVNEATEILYHEGRWYLTYSYFGYTDVRYSVGIAVSDNPLGPYDKFEGAYNPVLGKGDEPNNYKAGTGHHCFIKAGDELFFLYHATHNPENNYDNSNNYLGRHLGVDRGIWKYDPDLGYDMLFCNGATANLQPKPETYTGYTDVAKYATVTGNGDVGTADMLNDGLVTAQPFSRKFEYGKSDGGLYVTLTWDSPVKIKAIMLYNSASYYNAFNKVNAITFKLYEKPAWYKSTSYNGYCYIKDLAVDPKDQIESYTVVRHGSAAIAEFNEITVTEMTVYVSGAREDKYTDMDEAGNYAEGYKQVNMSEVYVFGNKA